MLRVMVELSPPDTKSEMMISSNDVRNEISEAEISEQRERCDELGHRVCRAHTVVQTRFGRAQDQRRLNASCPKSSKTIYIFAQPSQIQKSIGGVFLPGQPNGAKREPRGSPEGAQMKGENTMTMTKNTYVFC